MAFLDPSQYDEDELKQAQAASEAPAGDSLAQAPSTATGLDSSTDSNYSPTDPTSGTKGSGFQNLQAYLDANQGNTLGSQVAGKIGEQAGKARQDLRSADSSFRQSVDANTVNYDANEGAQVLANPLNASEEDTKEFQAALNASYRGPRDAVSDGGYQKAVGIGKDAYNSAQAVKNEGGRFSLLERYFGNPNYTGGQKSLDNALIVGGDQTGLNAVQSDVQDMPAEFQQTAQDLSTYAGRGESTTAASRSSARKALGIDDAGNLVQRGTGRDAYGNPLYTGAIGEVQNAANLRAGEMNKAAPEEYKAILDALGARATSGLTAEQRASLGDLASYKGYLYGLDPSAYLTANAANATARTAITGEEQAKLAALYNLAGASNTFAPNSAEAGTSPKPYQFRSGEFGSALSTAKANSDAQISALQAQYDKIAIEQEQAYRRYKETNDPVPLSQINAWNWAKESLQKQIADAQAARGEYYDFTR